MTNENKPNVMKVTGMEINLSMGFTKVFKILITNATMTPVINESTYMPFRYRGTIIKIAPIITNLTR
jgi:hypothetical protein